MGREITINFQAQKIQFYLHTLKNYLKTFQMSKNSWESKYFEKCIVIADVYSNIWWKFRVSTSFPFELQLKNKIDFIRIKFFFCKFSLCFHGFSRVTFQFKKISKKYFQFATRNRSWCKRSEESFYTKSCA